LQLRYVAAALALCLVLPAHAQILSDSDARKAILELRAKLADQERVLQQKDMDLSARLDRLENAQRNQLELANQTEMLRQEIARLRGQIEALTNEVATLQKRNRDLYADLDARLKKMEPSTVAVDGKSVAVDRNELTAYETALSQFRASDFKGALASFQQFVARYPQSAYVPVAHYWIGSSHYALKEYKSAIAAQQILVDRYSDSTRAPDALLSIAESQLQLADKRSANRTLGRLIKEYPESEAAKVARERLPATR
jgi:tol-pal system protein YbgF